MFEFLSSLLGNVGGGLSNLGTNLSNFGSSVGSGVANYGNSIGDFFSGANAGSLAPYPQGFDANSIVWTGANDSGNKVMESFLNNMGQSFSKQTAKAPSIGDSSSSSSSSRKQDSPLTPIGDSGNISIGGKVSVGENKNLLASLVREVLNNNPPLSTSPMGQSRNLPPDTSSLPSPISVMRGSNGELVVYINGKKITGSGNALGGSK